ncbi:MAG TPA: DUF2252 domain-containing protein [Solirubrobacteraceae bacterium]|nr:DUF2252 domain-containing protein [Solirubrobacteraceae bacterium]
MSAAPATDTAIARLVPVPSGAGREARRRAPRSSHGDWSPALDRPDPLGILEEQAAPRVKELVPIRHGRMAENPFAFFRGGAAIMAADLSHTPASGIVVQLCGDAHISNFGAFAAPDRRVVFSPNDFDETLPGPWEWDVKRMAASAEIAAREAGLSAATRSDVVRSCTREYRDAMRDFASRSNLDVWYLRLTADELIDRFGDGLGSAGRIQFARAFGKPRRKDHDRAVKKLTQTVDGRTRFRSVPPLLVPVRELVAQDGQIVTQERGVQALGGYAEALAPDRRHLLGTYEVVDMARKVVGVGSVGTRAWIFLLVGRRRRDALVLQAKEASASVLERYIGGSEFTNGGERVVRGQRMSQAASDIFLGWQSAEGIDGRRRDFYVRQLWDWKASADLAVLSDTGLEAYCRACAWSLARAHARSGDRVGIAEYIGPGEAFIRAIARFASAYADQNEVDHARFVEAIAAGDVDAVTGV